MRAFISGAPAWQSGSAWAWYWAAPVTLLIFLLAQAAGVGVVMLGSPSTWAGSVGEMLSQIDPLDMRILLASQIATIVLAMLAAYLFGSNPTRQLRLGEPEGGARAYLLAILVMTPVLLTLNAFIWTLAPQDALRDFLLFKEMAKRADWLVPALAICLGAPLSEELLFRGFLLTPLASSRLGYWPAAVLVALAWTMLHLSYSTVGLIEVFIIGIFLSWTLRRTGSLYVPIFCHALYNTFLFLLLRWMP